MSDIDDSNFDTKSYLKDFINKTIIDAWICHEGQFEDENEIYLQLSNGKIYSILTMHDGSYCRLSVYLNDEDDKLPKVSESYAYLRKLVPDLPTHEFYLDKEGKVCIK